MSDSSNSFWQALPALKERQRRTGLLAALVLGLAVLVLVDGLQALMRAGSYHLDIVAGQGTMLSGPIGIDKPRDSDLLVSVTPEGAPLSFRLDGFFASYWFGNGMWRGEIVAEQGATPGTYALSVRVRGTPASATQRYEVTVWSDAASQRQGAYSLTVSLLGFNPFWLSGILACIGIVPGLLSFLSGRRIVRLLDLALEHRRVDISLRSFMRNTVRVIFTLLLVLIVVSTLGVNVTSLIAVFSAATLAIGMALSGTAQNFAGGVMILLMKPYRVGDYISAQGQSGTVREIKLFSTVITTADNQTIYIPNNSIATAIIDNYSTSDTRRVDWTIGISYGDDVDTARAAILAILAADNRVLGDPAPVVWVAALADSSVNLSARAWVKNGDYWNVFFENNEKFYKQLPEKGINFPFPQMDVHVKNN